MIKWNMLPPAKPDPIFSISAEARAAGKEAIDATIGVYINEEGDTKLFPSVKNAMQIILKEYSESSTTYTPLLGIPEYRNAVTELVLPNSNTPVACIATTGGTGSLAINLRLLKLLNPEIQVCIPTPAWTNYVPLCHSANISFQEVSVLSDCIIDHQIIIELIKKTSEPCAILLQAGCTNPTGIDLTEMQWKEIIPILSECGSTVILDFAYQGFANDPKTDAKPAKILMEAGIPTLISWSASKNHSLYRFRTGLALANIPNENMCEKIEMNYSMLSRGLWSTAPALGQQIVAETQLNYKQEWINDLKHVRKVLEQKRSILRDNLPHSFQSQLNGNGLFAVLPLDVDKIHSLRKEHKVFILDDGRINIAGVPAERLIEFCEKVSSVI
ncbi:MAG: aminotransferase class I/II-fold pyridoxal phosphate-dependent enzyme, partial [Candidatus Peribacteraceae bacterium]|nr:aminotransferase class I/II-fold pyridoxal phosphate-dependent enzyme [Candidatus Peribacteraceae bacterium]